MYCRNYLEQYSRTKSIKQISKNHRNSYKLISQQNSALLKKQLSQSNMKNENCGKSIQKTTIAIRNSINRVKTNLELRKNQHASINSVSSLALQNQDNQCRKFTIAEKTTNSSLKKSHKVQKSHKNLNKNVHLLSIQKKDSSALKQKSFGENQIPKKKLSIDNLKHRSQYSTIVETQPNTRYSSIAVQKCPQKKIELVNSPQQYAEQFPQQFEQSNQNKNSLNQIYHRMKKALQINQFKQRQWQRERTYYVNKISELEEELKEYSNFYGSKSRLSTKGRTSNNKNTKKKANNSNKSYFH